MPTVIASATEDEMIATFLQAEVNSSCFREQLEQSLERHGLTVELVRFPDMTDEVANRARRELLATYRGWGQEDRVFGNLPADRVEWMWGKLEESELRERVFYIRYFWEDFSGGSRRPSDVAERLRRREPEVESVDVYLEILDDIRSGHMSAEPILLAKPRLERLLILEGHLRITAYLVDPVVVSFPIRALVGVSPEISECSEW